MPYQLLDKLLKKATHSPFIQLILNPTPQLAKEQSSSEYAFSQRAREPERYNREGNFNSWWTYQLKWPTSGKDLPRETTKPSRVTRKFNEVFVPTAQNLTTLNVIIASDNSDYAAIYFHHSCSSTTNHQNYSLPHVYGSLTEVTYWIAHENAILKAVKKISPKLIT